METLIFRNIRKIKKINLNIDLEQNPKILESIVVPSKKRKTKKIRVFFKKTHKWLGLIVSILVLNFAISGIILEHRDLFSRIDIPRSWLPNDYHYSNWNNSAIKGIIPINSQENLIFGNIGIWKESRGKFSDFNGGLESGADNRNISSVIKTSKGNLYAGSLFSFFHFDETSKQWEKIKLPTEEQRVVKIIEKDGYLLIMTRSHLLKMIDGGNNSDIKVLDLKPPVGYKKEISMFQTFWQIHNGEIFGIAGRLFVDFLGLVFIFLTITGLIKWYFPKTFKKISADKIKLVLVKKINLYSLHWHNKFGVWTLLFLVISTITGIFLRPPLLILIAESNVPQIKGTNLSQNNCWYDKLRNITYNKINKNYIIATDENLYYVDENFAYCPEKFNIQPPVSIMGVNVLESREDGGILVGSFNGLFLWYPQINKIYDYVTKEIYIPVQVSGPPVGAFKTSGYAKLQNGYEYYFDYDLGAVPLNSEKFYYSMSKEIKEKSNISLWNTALEFHTARIFKALISDFYILIVPLSGILIFLTLISGLIVWFYFYKGKTLIK